MKWRNGDGGDWCTMAYNNSSCHGLAPSFFEKMTCCWCQKHHRRWPGNPNGQSKFHKYCAYLPIWRLTHLLYRHWCFTAGSNGSYHRLAPSFFKEMTRCRRQKHCQRWPGNHNGQSKFHNYRTYLQWYVYKITTDTPRLTAASGDYSNGT